MRNAGLRRVLTREGDALVFGRRVALDAARSQLVGPPTARERPSQPPGRDHNGSSPSQLPAAQLMHELLRLSQHS